MSTLQKIRSLLTPAERKRAAALFALMIIGMILETVGVGLVIPAVALMTQEGFFAAHPEVRRLAGSVGIDTQTQLLTIGVMALVALYLVKNAFLAFLGIRQTRFAFTVQAHLSQRLFEIYLRQPYTFHLQRNSARLTHNTLTEVGGFTSVLMETMLLSTEILVLIGVGSLLLAVEPIGALIVVGVLALVSFGFHAATRAPITRWGIARQFHEAMRVQHVQQGFGGVKEVKLLGREQDFLDQYALHTTGSARVAQYQSALKQLPRLWLEILTVTGLAALVFTMVAQGRSSASMLSALALFAAAAFRLMPSVTRILGATHVLRYSLPIINTLHAELSLPVPSAPARASGKGPEFQSEIKLVDIGFRYPDVDKLALNGVSISIRKGEAVGIIGSSGAGKSTLVDIILGLLTPVAGAVLVDGRDIQHQLRLWQDRIGYVPQSIYLTDDTLRRNVAFGLPVDDIDERAVERAIRAAQLDHFVASLPDGLETVVGERGVRLSGGQRQRIGIARALYHDPAVLVLDEATSALDTATERGVMDAVAALHGTKTVLVVAHRSSTVQYCDRLYRLDAGRVIAEGTPEELLPSKRLSVAV